MPGQLVRLPNTVAQTRALLDVELPRLFRALQVIADDESGNRRRLLELREHSDYDLAFTERNPLVSVVIPTYTGHETLRDRAIPSVLAQTYPNLELVIVGDGAPPETAEVVASFDDPRVVYDNLPARTSYPDDRFERWLVSGVPAYNAAVRMARGRWISPFSDDDALRPDAIATVVEAAQRERWEVVYGVVDCLLPGGRRVPLGSFPPVHGGFGLQGAIYHAGLKLFEHQLSDAVFQEPHDWGMARRMLRAGVVFGFIDVTLADYFPTSNPFGFVPGG
jgi:glycosyltransferase involved in cell wall biosynthesis